MERIVITGGIASGKSTVTRYLRERGEVVLDADAIYHRMIGQMSPLTTALSDAFGTEVLAPGGGVDRRVLSARVVSDPDALKKLEDITHPAIFEALAAEAEAWERRGLERLFLDLPLYFETIYHAPPLHVDAVWVVSVSFDTQLSRLMAREAMSEAEARARIALQMPLVEKARRADVVIRNDGTEAELIGQLNTLLQGEGQ
ncbi:MAG: dephospho-CoA kinase [Peptoniphilaceae bacterium]|nr:dephospho-CoA kinase [Peptoniphilaceae bacterium]